MHADVHAAHQVRRKRVRTQAQVDSCLAEAVERNKLLLVAEGRQRAVDNADAVPGQQVQRASRRRRGGVLAVDHDTMRDQQASAEQAGRFEQFQDAASRGTLQKLVLERGLEAVEPDDRVPLPGYPRRLPHEVFGQCLDAARQQNAGNERVCEAGRRGP